MQLSGEQHDRICSALVAGFSKSELRALVRTELNESLETITDGTNLADTAYELVSWAERRGRIDDLIRAAYKQNPRNHQIQQLAQDAQVWHIRNSGVTAAPTISYDEPVNVRKSDGARTSGNTVTVQHDDKPPSLQKIFLFLADWVQSAGFSPVFTATDQQKTSSYKYFVNVAGSRLSFCTIQYMPQDNSTYVEFRFQGNTLQACELQQQIDVSWRNLEGLARGIAGITPKFTTGSKEYKVRISSDVLSVSNALEQITSALDPVLRSAAKQGL